MTQEVSRQMLSTCGTDTPVRWDVMCSEREQAGEAGKRVTLDPNVGLLFITNNNQPTKQAFFFPVVRRKLIDMKFALFLLISSITWGRICNLLGNRKQLFFAVKCYFTTCCALALHVHCRGWDCEPYV